MSLGKEATPDTMFEELQAAKAKDVVRFANAETTVGSPDQIRKLLRLVEICTQAGVYPLLKSLSMLLLEHQYLCVRVCLRV